MRDNPFDITRPTPNFAPPVIPVETSAEEPLRLSESDAAFLEKESEAEPLVLPEEPKLTLRQTLYWLLSFTLNVIVLIVLALLFFPAAPEPLAVEAIFSDQIGDQLDVMTLEEGNLNPTQDEEYKMDVPAEVRVDEMNVFERDEKDFFDEMPAPFYDQSRIEITQLLSGRTDPGTKNDLLAKYGGTHETREAVRLGLLWLKRQQTPDGSWSLKGPYRDGINAAFTDNPEAATAMALLAFQGDGNTRALGDHKETVRKGWTWLLKRQGKDGSFFPGGTASNRFYTQAICTIALCELIAMERETGKGGELRTIAQKGVDYLVRWQNKKLGGWRYDEGIGSDLSVTGWVLMALQTARVADLHVPQETFDRISGFLDTVAYDGGAQYVYCPEEPQKRPSMTATGLLCREYLGWDKKNETLLRGAEILTRPENLVRFEPAEEKDAEPSFDKEKRKETFYTNVYGWYSASMTLKHLGPYNKYWRTWNKAMSAELPSRQSPPKSAEAGSWNPEFDSYRFGGGRLYVTALSILCLEVYYRHLSLYSNP